MAGCDDQLLLTQNPCCTIFVSMRNITITLDDDTAKWVRVQAAMRDTSVSRLVGDMLRRQRRQEAEYDSAMVRFLGRGARTLKARDEEYPDRDSLHERPLLR
jgi:hypothetical protein